MGNASVHVAAFRKACKTLKLDQDHDDANWISHQRPSVAMLQCLGSGPWKFMRRLCVQTKALAILDKRDIKNLSDSEITEMFPLDWQRRYLTALRDVCAVSRRRFDVLGSFTNCDREKLCVMFGVEKLVKVQAMYVRDYLLKPSFPIDRHVRKWLTTRGLPTNEDAILNLCELTGFNPNAVNRAIFGAKSANPRFHAQ